MKSVLLLSDFLEDRRISMDLYSDMLEKYLSNEENGFAISKYIPRIPGYLNNKQGLRLARYISYPLQTLGKKASIYHITDHGYGHLTYFLDPNKCVITVHDLIPILRWKRMIPRIESGQIPILALVSFYALRRARHLISVSNSTKKDLVRILGINPEHISVVYSGVDPIFHPFDESQKKEAREKWFGKENNIKRILITGHQFYKNHETALKTIQLLQSNGNINIQLVKIGYITNNWCKLIQSYGLENNVINLDLITRESLPCLYNAVDLLLFPSIYEGSGWPPLEAMACGIPVVSSNVASIPEIVGNAGIMHDPYDYSGFATSIMKLLSNKDYYEGFIEKGLRQAKKFTWSETGKQVTEIYNAF